MDGNKIRLLRKEKDFTIEQLANLAGFTASYVSQVERNKIEPSLTALNKLSKVLNVSLYYFLEEQNDRIVITRKENRKIIACDKKASISLITHLNENSFLKPKFYAYEICLKPSEWDSNDYNTLNCQKCIIVKKGTLFIEFGTYNEILQTGDSIYIDAKLAHKCYNPTSLDVEILCISSSLELS